VPELGPAWRGRGRALRLGFTPGLRPGAALPAHVLIADDYPDLRNLMRIALECAGYQVTEVADGASADAALAAGGFACAVLDNRMPLMTGGAVLVGMRARGDATPVLIASASLAVDDVPDVSPPPYLLHKPFELAALVAAVGRALGQPPAAEPPRSWLASLFW